MNKILTLLAFAASALTTSLLAADRKYVGGDISLLPEYERYNTPYYDADGQTISDVVTYVHETCGWNAVRVRLFVTPTERSSGSKTGVVQDLDYVKALGKRVKDAGMALMVDFHYSDSWADPSYQDIPASWKTDTSDAALADSVYQYTRRCLAALSEAGATPDYVQVGNEVSYGMLWRSNSDKVFPAIAKSTYATQWSRLSLLLNSGAKAVREVCPEAKIVIHTERSGSDTQTANFYSNISDVDYDVIGLSYYCFYHGALSDLAKTLGTLQSQFASKEVQIVETSYYYNWYPSDVTYNFTSSWLANEAGQLQYTQDLIATLLKYSNVTGLYWWFPEENGNGGATWNANTIVIDSWLNRGLWDDSSHKALKALYALRDFRADDEAIEAVCADALPSAGTVIYDLSGKPVTQHFDELPHGMYIVGGKKVMR